MLLQTIFPPTVTDISEVLVPKLVPPMVILPPEVVRVGGVIVATVGTK